MSDSGLPSSLDFIKLACGQLDFLLWDQTEQRVVPTAEDLHEAARQVCPRRTGVGACGLLVLTSHEGDVRASLYRPGRPDSVPNYPSLLCAAKYLRDGARYGPTAFTFTWDSQVYRIHPIDSLSMAVDLNFATSRKRPALQNEELGHRTFLEGAWALQGTFLEGERQKALIFFQPELELDRIGPWKRAVFRLRQGPYLPTVVQLASPRLLHLEYRPAAQEPDTVVLASLAAQAAYLNGLIDEDVVVRIQDHPYFVHVDLSRQRNRVMVPIRYVFRGNFSFTEFLF